MTEVQGVAARIGAILCLLLCALYLITYTGRIESGDEYRIVDGITSLVHFGDTGRDETLWFAPPDALVTSQRYPISPLPEDEASLAALAAPLYMLAHAVPGLGLLHVVWLYNILITVLTGMLVYAVGLALGYGWKPAFLVALAFGAGTIAWPYSRTLFRDPTVMMLITFCFWMALIARQSSGRRRLLALFLLAGGVVLAAWVKVTALFALPALLVFAAPRVSGRPRLRRVLYALIGCALVLGVALAFVPGVPQALQQLIPAGMARWFRVTAYTQAAVHSYLFSANGSVWGASPVLLLGIPGAALLLSRGKPRLLSAALLLAICYAVGHAYLTGVHWFGGLSIPPRFMLPVVPLAALLMLPVAQAVFQGSRWAILCTVSLTGFSIWVQWVNSVTFPQTYVGLLPPESQGLAEWLPALNELRYARWLLQPQTWGALGWDTAWWRGDLAWWAWCNAGLILLSLALTLWVRAAHRRLSDLSLAVTALLLVSVNVMGLLHLNQRDPVVRAERTAMQEVMNYLEEHADPGDPLVVPYGTFEMYLLNYNRSYTVRPLVMPKQPGEAISARVPGEVQSPRVLDLLTWFTVRALYHLSLHHDRAWLIMDTNAFQPWATRVIEHFLAEHYYYVQEIPTSDPQVRLLEFALQPQPFAGVLRQPDVQTDLVYGDMMALKGVTLANDGAAAPGDYITLELVWEALQPVPVPAVVSVFLATEDGRVVAQGGDSMPAGGFAPTTGWVPGVPVTDRRAIAVPAGAAPGRYRLWVVVYHFVEGVPVRYGAAGAETIEGTIGVLPLTIPLAASSPS
jgi:hypothetical protein